MGVVSEIKVSIMPPHWHGGGIKKEIHLQSSTSDEVSQKDVLKGELTPRKITKFLLDLKVGQRNIRSPDLLKQRFTRQRSLTIWPMQSVWALVNDRQKDLSMFTEWPNDITSVISAQSIRFASAFKAEAKHNSISLSRYLRITTKF